MVDFKSLRDIPLLDVCRLLNIPLKQSGAYHRGACPICRNKSQRCFVVTVSMNRWWCHGNCKRGGDPLQLVAIVKGVAFPSASKWLHQHFEISPA